MQAGEKKQQKLKKRLENVLKNKDLQQQKLFLAQLEKQLNVSKEDCAAALLYLVSPGLFQSSECSKSTQHKNINKPPVIRPAIPKSVRYRLHVGSQHGVSADEIKQVLVQESGVDIKRITRVDIKSDYTVVELPDGMPADIFQLLSETEIRQQKLKLKRLKPQRRYRRYRRN